MKIDRDAPVGVFDSGKSVRQNSACQSCKQCSFYSGSLLFFSAVCSVAFLLNMFVIYSVHDIDALLFSPGKSFLFLLRMPGSPVILLLLFFSIMDRFSCFYSVFTSLSKTCDLQRRICHRNPRQHRQRILFIPPVKYIPQRHRLISLL